MGRPVKYHTPEEKREAMRAAWRKYGEGHREERCEANREYVRRPLVKARIHEMRKSDGLARQKDQSRSSRRVRLFWTEQYLR